MASHVYLALASLFCMVAMVNGRFLLYDTDNSETKVDIGAQLADIKKLLVNLSALVNEFNNQSAGTSPNKSSNVPLQTPRTMTCRDGWITYRESCYYFDSDKLNYQSAEKKCQQWKAHIVRLETRGESDFLKSLIRLKNQKEHYWIGISDVETEGVWKISGTNQSVPFTDWKSPEPNNLNRREHCAVLAYILSWIDVPCGNPYQAVCERNFSSPSFNTN